MTTVQQTGSIDLGANNTAAKTATNYITADNSGIRVHNTGDTSDYVQITSDSMDVYNDGTNVARFGSDGTRIGKPYVQDATDNESHMELDYHSLQMVDKNGNTYLHVSDLRGADGKTEIVNTFVGNGTTKAFTLSLLADNLDYTVSVSDSSGGTVTKYLNGVSFNSAPTSGATITVTYETKSPYAKAYTLGSRRSGDVGPYSFVEGRGNVASGNFSHAEGYWTAASGDYTHAEGMSTTASRTSSHAEGGYTTASGGFSHAEGYSTTASGTYSHAEGSSTTASGTYSHAEGLHTTANGNRSHAEGEYTTTNGYCSHAEGEYTTANGYCSHAQNNYTTAASNSQTAIGKYNVEDTSDAYAFIIGNGRSNTVRSNAAVIDWLGNYIAQGWAGITQMFAGAVTQTVDSNGVATATGAPAGWLLCDGSAVSRTEYATLYAAIGDTWGAGDGSTTFNLPDLRGRTAVGVDPNGLANSYDESSNMLLTDSAMITQEQYLAYKLKLSGRSLAANTRYTLQLFDVHISHTGKTETTIGLGVWWGAGGIENHFTTVYAHPDYDGETGLKSYTANGYTYAYCKHLTITLDTEGTTQGVNELWIYNSPDEASGTRLVEIGRWMLNAETDGALPWEPRRWFHRYGAYDLGASGGIDHPDIQTMHLPSHTHGKGTLAITASGSHHHDVKGYGDYVAKGTNYYRYGSGGSKTATIGMTNETHTHPNANFTGNTGATGGGNSFDIRSSYAVVNYIIHTGKTS